MYCIYALRQQSMNWGRDELEIADLAQERAGGGNSEADAQAPGQSADHRDDLVSK